MNYIKKLDTSQWRNKCKKILKRDGYKCTVCGNVENLRVHHTYYYDDFSDPWEYPDKSLITVCEKCHNEYHKTCEVEIRKAPKKKGKKLSKKQKIKRENVFHPKKEKKQLSLADYQIIRGLKIKKRIA